MLLATGSLPAHASDSTTPHDAIAEASDASLISLAHSLAAEHSDLFGWTPRSALVLRDVRRIGALRVVRFRQSIDGYPVRRSRWFATFFQDENTLRLVRVDNETVSTDGLRGTLPPDPIVATLSAETAAVLAADHVRIAPSNSAAVGLEFVRIEESARLAHLVEVRCEHSPARYRVFVDAKRGEVLAAYDTVCYGDLVGTVEALGTPGLAPDLPTNPATPLPLRELTVTPPMSTGGVPTTTDDDGSFVVPDVGTDPLAVSFPLVGPWVSVENAAGPNYAPSFSLTPDVPFTETLNPTDDPLVTAQINGFVHTQVAHDFLKSIDPTFDVLDFPIPCFVNLSTVSCNAYYDEGAIHFALADGDCVNTAYSTLVYHEYAHAVLDLAHGFEPGSYHEGMADAFSALLTNDPEIGIAFEAGETLRDIDTTDRVYPDDASLGAHESGLILGGAFWDTKLALESSVGTAEALEITSKLWLHHMVFETGFISPLITIDVLTIDDDNGNLLDGTPNFAEIDAGFSAHGLLPPTFGAFTFANASIPGDTLDSAGPYPVSVEVTSTDATPIATVELVITTEGHEQTLPLTETSADIYSTSLPGFPLPTAVHFYFRATDALGRTELFPESAPQNTWSFLVGGRLSLFESHFDDGDADLSHTAAEGQDDWQHGPPNVQGNHPWDPLTAFSAPAVWGNDLNQLGWNGDYADNTRNRLELPPLDCTNISGLHLRYRRWLTVERAPFDRATVTVNGFPIWQNSAGGDHLDTEWVEVMHDLSAWTDGEPQVVIAFELVSDNILEYGGWNLDDVSVFTVVDPGALPFVRGECNLDGRVDLADPIRLLQTLFDGGDPLPCEDACDANDDGVLNLDDAIALLDHVILGASPLPAPVLFPAPDPTADNLGCTTPTQ
ncbi:MAG: hypothetical protein AAF488_09890 [Planctomycetota bacterium]